MVFCGETLNGAFFRKLELQIAAALYLYCQNGDGTYADAELIGEIILDMRKLGGPTLPCQGIETFLRDSPNPCHQEAWCEVVTHHMEWRQKAETAYWGWRDRKTELFERLAREGKLVRSFAVVGYDKCLRETPNEYDGQGSQGGHGG